MTTLRRKSAGTAMQPLVLRFRPGLRLSDGTFLRLCRANPDLRLERSARGDLIVMAPATPDSSQRNMSLLGQLWSWNQRNGLGIVFESSAGFTLPNDAIRSPDAAWTTRARWEALSQDERDRFSHIVPDFVIELRSSSDQKGTLRAKMREYADQGVRLGWLIDLRTRTVEVYRPGHPATVLKQPTTLSGEDVLPGFVLDLKSILFD